MNVITRHVSWSAAHNPRRDAAIRLSYAVALTTIGHQARASMTLPETRVQERRVLAEQDPR